MSNGTGRRTWPPTSMRFAQGWTTFARSWRIEALGGEGLMLRQPESRYEVGRSLTLLKVKNFRDAEARVLEQLKGAGRHKGRLGRCLWNWPTGRGSRWVPASPTPNGRPPAVGSVITFRYQELSEGGVPRFPSFVGIRGDAVGPTTPTTTPSEREGPGSGSDGSARASAPAVRVDRGIVEQVLGSGPRRLRVTVRYGRIGSDGQAKTKEFASEELAHGHADGLIEEKVAKGYRGTALTRRTDE